MGNVEVFPKFDVCILEAIFDVSRHGYVKGSGIVVPIEVNATVEVPCPVLGKLVFFLYASNEMVDMIVSNIFNSKIVDD
jgi:hypothetical protein